MWKLHWEMDGMLWGVLSIDIYSPEYPITEPTGIQDTYENCVKFIHMHLLGSAVKSVTIHFPEFKQKLLISDIKQIMTLHFPEELI